MADAPFIGAQSHETATEKARFMPPVLIMEGAGRDASHLRQFITAAGFETVSVTDIDAVACQHGDYSITVLASPFNPSVIESIVHSPPKPLREVPIVVVAADPLDKTAKVALQTGVAGIVPCSNVAVDLGRTLHAILPPHSAPAVDSSWRPLCYTIDNNPELIPLIVAQVQRRLEQWSLPDPLDLVRVIVALSESLENALYHGNLELSSDLRQGDGFAWRDESLRRRSSLPYRDRRIRFQADVSRTSARFTIRDEGPGFNPWNLRDCTESENLERCSGRGLHLMRMYMDDVQFNATGNEVVLVKHRPTELNGELHPIRD